ncbi:MAG: zinc ABC transporter substrate-binding protein [Actinomycetia bacterium]|nr:zinc ABC transporter substrate-binding protein [Actinomycetes bacterium]
MPQPSTAVDAPLRLRSAMYWLLAATVPLLLATAACASSDDAVPATSEEASGPVIVATTTIWADVVANVACDDQADVRPLIPAGADPHGFELALVDRETMDSAALIVANGLFLEEAIQDTIENVEDSGVPIFRFTDHIATIEYFTSDDHDESHDPHVWFDPTRVSAALPTLAERLIDDAGLDPATVQACLAAYQSELADLDSEISGLVEAVPEANRKLVTNHDSLGYFADRYGFEIVGTVIPASSGLAATNPAHLEALAVQIEAANVPAIFSESQHSAADAQALASAVTNGNSVEIVTLITGTLSEPGSTSEAETETYLGFLVANTRLITRALS